MKLTITLPLPAPNLSPNSRVHWAAKARSVRKARRDGALACGDAMVGAGMADAPYWKQAQVRCRFLFRQERKRDTDNALASCKAYFDSFADCGLIEDDCGLTHLPPEIGVDRKQPRLEIEIERGKHEP